MFIIRTFVSLRSRRQWSLGPLLGALLTLTLPGYGMAACSDPAGPGVDWSRCDKSGADLTGANLSGANLGGATLTGANLSGADLSNATLIVTQFIDATLSNATLSNATLSNANLTRARLSGANLSNATLSRAILRNASLSSADLSNANLTGASLVEAALTDADLTGATLSNADLSRAGFFRSILVDANFSGANLSNAIFPDADLSGAIGVPTNLTNAGWRNTICPDDTNSDDNGGTCTGHFNTPPLARCTNVTVDATATSCSFPASIDNGSSDPDSGDSITVSQTPAGPYGLGGTLVTLTVTDSHNAQSTCTGTVTVRDTVPPPLSCPSTITAECAGASTSVTFATPQPGADNCGLSQSTGCNRVSGAGFSLGSTAVSCEATDTRNTASCSFNINVVDTIAPSITCPAASPVEATSAAGASVTFAPPTAADVCTTPSVSCDATSGATFILGTTSVHCTASDGSHTTFCSFDVTVQDTTAPSLTCPANVIVTTGQPVSLGTPTVSDLVDTNPIISNNAPASYPIGTTTVTWTVRDADGNTSSCQQTVQVSAPPLLQTTALIATVDSLPVSTAIKVALKTPLQIAKVALQNNQPQVACGSLRVFEALVTQLRQANKLTAAQAGQLTTSSQSIRTSLGCA